MNKITIETPDITEVVKLANLNRRLYPNKWLEIHFLAFGAVVKSYGTTIQLMRKNGVSWGGLHDLSVSRWKLEIQNMLEC